MNQKLILNKTKWEKLFPYLISLVFIILGSLLILKHELYSDEVISWLMGSESSSLKELFLNTKTNVGHQSLWFLLTYFISHFITKNLESIKILHVLISSVIVFLVLKYSPFNKITKILFVFSYLIFYEYTIISRNYSIGILAMIVFCILYKDIPKNLFAISISLFFMAQANIYSLIITFMMFFYLVFELIKNAKKNEFRNIKSVIISISIIIIIVGLILSLWQLLRQSNMDGTKSSILKLILSKNTSSYMSSLKNISNGVISSMIQLQSFKINFWESNIIYDNLIRFDYTTYILAIILSILPIFLIRKKYIFMYIFGLLGIISVPLFLWPASIRHSGHIFIVFFISLWLSEYNKSSDYILSFKWSAKIPKIFLTLLLCVSLIGTVNAYYHDYRYNFSNGKNIAKYIKNNFDLDNTVIIGYPNGRNMVIAAYLNKDLYYPQTNQFEKLVIRNESIDIEIDNKELLKLANSFVTNSNSVILSIQENSFIEISKELSNKYSFNLIKNKDKIIIDENYYLIILNKNIFLKNSELLFTANSLNFENYWNPTNNCKFNILNNRINLVNENDPWFESKFSTKQIGNKSLLMIVEIFSPIVSKFQVFYNPYSEKNSISYPLREGNNIIFVKIPYVKGLDKIRIDPVDTKVNCYINSIKVYSY